MFKEDALEAVPILQRALDALMSAAPTRGRAGSDLRTACGALHTNALVLITSDIAGPPLVNCFNIARSAAISQKQVSFVRSKMLAEAPVSVGAVLIRDCIIQTCLATECQIIANMTFDNRQDVDDLKEAMGAAFRPAAETAADSMDAMTYRALVELHAAVTFYLIETARPLPRMLRFEFATPMPTLAMAQRLYYDGSRADELRVENKVIHPAFMLPTGRALSA